MIKHVSDENVQAWADMCAELWPGNCAREWLEDWHGGEFPNEFLFYAGDEAVAFLGLSLRTDYVEGTKSSPVGYIEGIFVKSGFRGRGIARALVDFAKTWALSQGCVELASDCELLNEESRLFHEKVGFKEAGRIICFTMDLPQE